MWPDNCEQNFGGSYMHVCIFIIIQDKGYWIQLVYYFKNPKDSTDVLYPSCHVIKIYLIIKQDGGSLMYVSKTLTAHVKITWAFINKPIKNTLQFSFLTIPATIAYSFHMLQKFMIFFLIERVF